MKYEEWGEPPPGYMPGRSFARRRFSVLGSVCVLLLRAITRADLPPVLCCADIALATYWPDLVRIVMRLDADLCVFCFGINARFLIELHDHRRNI